MAPLVSPCLFDDDAEDDECKGEPWPPVEAACEYCSDGDDDGVGEADERDE